MMRKDRMREMVSVLPAADAVRERAAEGWRLVAVEWERDVEDSTPQSRVEVPYGLRVASDCMHLEEDPYEREVLVFIMDQICDDRKLSEIVKKLNERGLVTRHGAPWTAPAVFRLLPRTVEAGPQVFSSPAWIVGRASARTEL